MTLEDLGENVTFGCIADTLGRVCQKNNLRASYSLFPLFPEGQKSFQCDAIEQEEFQSCPAVRICKPETVLGGQGPAVGEVLLG